MAVSSRPVFVFRISFFCPSLSLPFSDASDPTSSFSCHDFFFLLFINLHHDNRWWIPPSLLEYSLDTSRTSRPVHFTIHRIFLSNFSNLSDLFSSCRYFHLTGTGTFVIYQRRSHHLMWARASFSETAKFILFLDGTSMISTHKSRWYYATVHVSIRPNIEE
jgi:hypothetical protein